MEYIPIKRGTTARVLEVVLDDPGVNARHIQARLASDPACGDITGKQVSNSLAYLRHTKQIKNLGKHAKGASWYPTT